MLSIVAKNFTQYSQNLASRTCLYNQQLAVSLKKTAIQFCMVQYPVTAKNATMKPVRTGMQ